MLALVLSAAGLLISPAAPASRFAAACSRAPAASLMALDYKDPVVASEMALIQELSPDEVETELSDYELLAGIVLKSDKFKPQQKHPEVPKPEAVFEIQKVNRDHIAANSPFRFFTYEELQSQPFITLEDVSEPVSPDVRGAEVDAHSSE